MSDPARHTIITPRPPQEVFSFYGCPNPRCRVRHWPILPDTGDRCPSCDAQGFFKGIVGKLPDQPGGDAESDGGG